MFDLTVKIDRALLRMGKMPDSIRNALKAEVDALATKVRDKAKANAGTFFQVRTGKYLKSIKKSVRSNKTSVIGKVFSNDPVAHLLEKGVKPHDIRAKNVKALAFLGGTFAVEVHHPGFRGHTVINSAFQDMVGEIQTGLDQAVKDGAKVVEP